MLFTNNFVLIFIITILLLAGDFYYLKNIAGRRLVGLRWWNEVNTASGDSHWVFESSDPNERVVNKTDSRFFWMALYVQPVCWAGLAVLAITHPVYLSLIGEFCPGARRGREYSGYGLMGNGIVIALVLTITNTLAFSRCDKFSQASNLASSAMHSGGFASNIAGGLFNRLFRG